MKLKFLLLVLVAGCNVYEPPCEEPEPKEPLEVTFISIHLMKPGQAGWMGAECPEGWTQVSIECQREVSTNSHLTTFQEDNGCQSANGNDFQKGQVWLFLTCQEQETD